jgi:hypothetical protein
MGCDAILLDIASGDCVASNRILVIGFGACVVESLVDQDAVVVGRGSVAQIFEARLERSRERSTMINIYI